MDDFELAVESYVEKTLFEIDSEGKEVFVQDLSPEEKFEALIARIDFAALHRRSQAATSSSASSSSSSQLESDDSQEADIPLLSSKAFEPYQWVQKFESNRKAALSQFEQSVQLLKLMRENQLLDVKFVIKESEPDAKQLASMLQGRKASLKSAAAVLESGRRALKKQLEAESAFWSLLKQLRTRWVLHSPVASRQPNYTIDLSLFTHMPRSSSSLQFASLESVATIFRRSNSQTASSSSSVDILLPVSITHGHKQVYASELIPFASSALPNDADDALHTILAAAQDSLFDAEVFRALRSELLYNAAGEEYKSILVNECSENEIKVHVIRGEDVEQQQDVWIRVLWTPNEAWNNVLMTLQVQVSPSLSSSTAQASILADLRHTLLKQYQQCQREQHISVQIIGYSLPPSVASSSSILSPPPRVSFLPVLTSIA